MPLFDEISLDSMEVSELMSFWKTYHRATRRQAVELLGVRPKASRIAQTLASYACAKACGMSLRLEGKVARAMTYEQGAELAYQRLPEDVRW